MAKVIKPQPGPQEAFLATSADIAIYGGSAGGGKTWALLLEPLRHYQNKEFGAVIFRRNTTQIRNEGGLWDESLKLYPLCGAEPKESVLKHVFPSGASVKFAHLEYEKTVHDWQGSQIPLIGFDELTHFSEAVFFYMLSRNRSLCGVRPYFRATCNPDPDSWVAKFLEWWIDPDTGLAIDGRSGVIRYFYRVDNRIEWADTADALIKKYGELFTTPDGVLIPPKSVTFVKSSIYDNKILLRENPEYLANLKSLDMVNRERLLNGNWKIRAAAGLYFKRSFFGIVHRPRQTVQRVRGWDLASTEPHEGNKNPDATAGVLMGKTTAGRYQVEDCIREQISPAKVMELIKRTAAKDGKQTTIAFFQDPGQAGKHQKQTIAAELSGYTVKFVTASKDKVTMAAPFSSQAEAGNVDVVAGPWNDDYFQELENFPDGVKDDRVDASSRAFMELSNSIIISGRRMS